MDALPRWADAILGGESGRDRVETAIAEAEARTAGEIIPIVVRRSSTVGHVPPIAFLLLLVVVFLLDLPGQLTGLGGPYYLWVGVCWAAAALIAVLVARSDFVQRRLTSRLDEIRQVDVRAQLEFYELGISQTEGRTGVLLFVSLMEHRAVVLADRGIAEKLEPETWQEVVDLMTDGVKARDLAAGMTEAVERCGDLLAPHFPRAADDRNELRDHLVVKE